MNTLTTKITNILSHLHSCESNEITLNEFHDHGVEYTLFGSNIFYPFNDLCFDSKEYIADNGFEIWSGIELISEKTYVCRVIDMKKVFYEEYIGDSFEADSEQKAILMAVGFAVNHIDVIDV